jgi:hypothetical protein
VPAPRQQAAHPDHFQNRSGAKPCRLLRDDHGFGTPFGDQVVEDEVVLLESVRDVIHHDALIQE